MRTVDGAGVHLVRVLSINTVNDYDPWLMLDSFDSEKPSDYINGFPPHPHRGIETITYLIEGEMTHGDSLGNKGVIHGGESQWMTAGSGIIHEEMPTESKRMLGVQLWLNLPKKDKMTYPKYFSITNDMVKEVETDFGKVRVVSGEYNGIKGVEGDFIKATLLDFAVKAGQEVTIPVKEADNAFVFLIDGDAKIEGKLVDNKSAVLFGDGTGDTIKVKAPDNADTRFLFCAGKPLHEEVAWGGPIVMNTQPELKESFKELQDGNFIKHDPTDK
ncbi:MAG: pirin family protein [Suipraeoptans sp.]